MDLMEFSQAVYETIRTDFIAFSEQLNIPDIRFIPISALDGDNVVNKSENTPWYVGPTLMDTLETIEISNQKNEEFRLPVQYVNRPDLNFRGFSGTIVSGEVSKGDDVVALPSGKRSKVKGLHVFEGELEKSNAPFAVTLTLEDEIDISRGDMIVKVDQQPLTSSSYKTHLVWMSEDALIPNKQYSFKFAAKTVPGSVSNLDCKIDVNTLEQDQAVHLNLNEIGVADIKLTQSVAADPYTKNRATGAFIIIDRMTNGTVGAGMVIAANQEQNQSKHQYSEFELEFNALVRKHFPHWQALDISQ
jgi:sulfate adenylyltransferase subunit 1